MAVGRPRSSVGSFDPAASIVVLAVAVPLVSDCSCSPSKTSSKPVGSRRAVRSGDSGEPSLAVVISFGLRIFFRIVLSLSSFSSMALFMRGVVSSEIVSDGRAGVEESLRSVNDRTDGEAECVRSVKERAEALDLDRACLGVEARSGASSKS